MDVVWLLLCMRMIFQAFKAIEMNLEKPDGVGAERTAEGSVASFLGYGNCMVSVRRQGQFKLHKVSFLYL